MYKIKKSCFTISVKQSPKCKDKLTSCDNILETRSCEEARIRKFCAKTCDACSPPAPPAGKSHR